MADEDHEHGGQAKAQRELPQQRRRLAAQRVERVQQGQRMEQLRRGAVAARAGDADHISTFVEHLEQPMRRCLCSSPVAAAISASDIGCNACVSASRTASPRTSVPRALRALREVGRIVVSGISGWGSWSDIGRI